MTSLGYSDGACKGNPGIGGWGATLFETPNGSKVLYRFINYGGKKKSTNQEMELTGFLELLKMCTNKGNYLLHSDSTYVVQALCGLKTMEGEINLSPLKNYPVFPGYITSWMEKGWKKADNNKVKYVHLWEDVVIQCKRILLNGSKLRIRWIKGHSGDHGNDLADKLANMGVACVK